MKPLNLLAQGVLPLVTAVMTELDNEAWRFLKPHENKIVCFEITDLVILHFQIKPQGLEIIDLNEQHVNVTFKGSLPAFTAMVFSKKAVHPDLHIRGDLECAKALYDTWQYLDCDWEGAVANLTHPTFAHGLFQGLKRARAWGKEMVEHRTQDFANYLQSEKGLLPTQEEMDDFIHSVEKCRDDVERLAAKIQHHIHRKGSAL